MPKLSEARFLLRLSQIRSSEDPEYTKRELEAALRDLVRETPLQSFSPGIVDVLSCLMPDVDRGATIKEWSNQIGTLAGDRAKDVFERLSKAQKAAAVLTAVGVAGAIAYQGGTRDLRHLGLEPSVSLRMPYDFKLRGSVDAGPHFKDPEFHASLSRDFAFDDGQRARIRVGDQFVGASYGIERGNLSAGIEARYNFEGRYTEAWGSAAWTKGAWSAAVSGSYDSRSGTHMYVGVFARF